MTITTEETLTANGVVLNTLAYNVGSLTGRLRTPGRRGADVQVPGRHGAIRTPRKRYAPGEVVLPMWVVGADEDGLVPTSGPGRDLLYQNVNLLSRIFGADTVELIHTLPDGSARRVVGEPFEAIDFTTMAGGSRAEFSVALSVAGAFWEDVDIVTTDRFDGMGSWPVAEFAGSTAVMDDLQVTFHGPANNPRVESAGVWARYNEVLEAGQSITLDCAVWALSGSGVSVDYTLVEHAGDLRWWVMSPGDPPVVEVSQTGVEEMGTTLSGRRKYMVG